VVAGDHLAVHGEETAFWIDAPATRVVCSPGAEGWMRVLMDSVLGTLALLRGREALHAGAVEIAGGALAVAGPPGAGKSSLLAALVARGHRLLADDVLVLEGPRCHPAPALMTLPAGTPEIGCELTRSGSERWVELAPGDGAKREITAICLLQRSGSGPVQAHRRKPSPLPVLAHLLPSGPEEERERARFEAACALAARADLVDLRGGLEQPLAAFADAAEVVTAVTIGY
jgi:hypothetical protein